MKHFTKKLALLSLLAGMCGSAWADIVETVVVNQNFDDGSTLFVGASRMTVANDNGAVKFTCANNSQNGYSLATYDFSSAIGTDASSVKIAFDFNIPSVNAAYRRFFTVGQADLRTGFGKTAYSTAGSMFAFGLARNSSANFFSINGASTTAAASATNVLGVWAHAEITVNLSAKTVNYVITDLDGTTTYYSSNNVAFTDQSAGICNQLDFFDCQNNIVSYLDNLVITKYVDKSKKSGSYTVKFVDTNNNTIKNDVTYTEGVYVGDTYNASSVDMATFYSEDESKKYIYKEGNASGTISETASENIITLVFNTYEEVLYSITAVDEENNLLKTLASGKAYSDGSTVVNWSKYILVNGHYYECSAPYGKAITSATEETVTFNVSDIAYFIECENMSKSRSAAATNSGTNYSGGYSPRHYSNSYWWTDAFENGGVFNITIPVTMANASSTGLIFRLYNIATGEKSEETLVTESFSTNKTYTFNNVIIPDGYALCICNETGYNSNACMDYLTLTRVTTGVTVTADGELDGKFYATYSNAEKALDFSAVEGLTAYYVTSATTSNITIEEVEKVPAGAAVLIAGAEATTYQVPVIPNFESTETNLLQVSNGEKTGDGQTIYVLGKGQSGVGFYLKKKDFAIAAGKAYLEIEDEGTNGVKSFLSLGGDDATAISNVEAAQGTGIIYNLNGQRVAAPVKGGLYIMNGKKVLVK